MKIVKIINNNKIWIIFIIFFIILLIYNYNKYIKVFESYRYKNPNEKEYDIILEWFNNFSNKYIINYSIAGGTMLGYVRNKKYIPWDDDVDIFIGKDDAYKIISLINNNNIIYNININIKNLKKDTIYIIINIDHNLKLKDRRRFNCDGNPVNSQIDSCSQNELFGRVIYNNVFSDIQVYTDNNEENEYSINCNDSRCLFTATDYGIKLPETKNIKINNIDTKIFKSEKLIDKLLSSAYGKNYLITDHKYKNSKWIKIK